jgi:low affinity Fe/Cu permease
MVREFFRKFAATVSQAAGNAATFILALLVVVVWALAGPYFHFSNTWQLVINTATTITTFLMVFLIQNTQNRNDKAMQLKLDELIRASRGARDSFVDLEDISDEELTLIDEQFRVLHHHITPEHPLHKLHNKIIVEHQRRKGRSASQ